MGKKVVKRKVGRPKGSKNKTSTESISKKRGRPKKTEVKNKIFTESIPKKRGRPKKVKVVEKVQKKSIKNTKQSRNVKKRYIPEEVDLSNVRRFKLLGFCPKCHGMIGDKDYEKGRKTIIVCYKCNKRCNVNKLLDQPKSISTEKPKSKKAFLESTISVHTEHTTYEDDIPEEFKSYAENWE